MWWMGSRCVGERAKKEDSVDVAWVTNLGAGRQGGSGKLRCRTLGDAYHVSHSL
jgi:hypothetical protein